MQHPFFRPLQIRRRQFLRMGVALVHEPRHLLEQVLLPDQLPMSPAHTVSLPLAVHYHLVVLVPQLYQQGLGNPLAETVNRPA